MRQAVATGRCAAAPRAIECEATILDRQPSTIERDQPVPVGVRQAGGLEP